MSKQKKIKYNNCSPEDNSLMQTNAEPLEFTKEKNTLESSCSCNLHHYTPFRNTVDFFEIGRFPKKEKYPQNQKKMYIILKSIFLGLIVTSKFAI